jgi:hypothetical protein
MIYCSVVIVILCLIKGTVQQEVRWVKIGINQTAMKICIAGNVVYHVPRDTITRGA